MRLLYLILTTLILVSCGPSSNEVVISQEDYKKLIGDTIKPEYPKQIYVLDSPDYADTGFPVYIGSDGHEYQRHKEDGILNQWTHYGGCKKCQKERDELNNKLNFIIQSIDTINNKNKNNE